eukprot:Seg2533.3 transcript_id=Seg2533.3/GoldUCD/mRNA.D3Y31 product="Acyl carrier protein mitochondrial" protein_id=Seg2533.3/GoldUCD/D3Y31
MLPCVAHSRSYLVLKMAAARACSNFVRRIALTQLTRKQITALPCLISTRGLSSLVSRVPQIAVVANKRNQPWRSYGDYPIKSVEELREETLNVLKLFDKVDPTKVTPEAHFINDLGLDSLDVVEVVMAFEDEFGCEISDEEAEKIFTVNDGVELLKNKLGIDH